ncbi:electron transfer flavoprotein subunit beta/FixA family protein [Desulfosporosinus fructosivorans]
MNIVVCIKQILDTEAKFILDDYGKIDASGISHIINPYDEHALEEGIRLKEKFGGVVIAVSMGGPKAQDALRIALAMGADTAVIVSDPVLDTPDEWVAAEVLAKVMEGLSYDIILGGRIAIDDGSSQVAVRLAENLKISAVSNILKLDITDKTATVIREIDGGTEVVEVNLPAVFTVQKGLNKPRYSSMAGIMEAKKKELKVLGLPGLDLGEQVVSELARLKHSTDNSYNPS